MFNNLINLEVEIIVSSCAETLLEYSGILYEENDRFVKLKDVSINFAMLNFQKNVFGNNINIYKQKIKEVILNKEYIISCNKK